MGRPREVTDQQILNAARRCLLERGTGVTAADIGRELGVSHTTLFHRFGSKENLLLAALGPPAEIPWVAILESGPDQRPIREQLVALGTQMSGYFQELQKGVSLLQAAGVDPSKAHKGEAAESAPERARRALVGWLARAQAQGRLGPCDTDALASTILSALYGWAFTAGVCGKSTSATSGAQYVERFVDLLWNGVGAG